MGRTVTLRELQRRCGYAYDDNKRNIVSEYGTFQKALLVPSETKVECRVYPFQLDAALWILFLTVTHLEDVYGLKKEPFLMLVTDDAD